MEILIVDDDADLRYSLRKILEHEILAIQVSEGSSKSEAIATLKSGAIDLVICDFNLSEGTGLDVFQFLEENPSIKTKFVMFTGNATLSDSIEWRERFIVVAKPDIDELLCALSFIEAPIAGRTAYR